MLAWHVMFEGWRDCTPRTRVLVGLSLAVGLLVARELDFVGFHFCSHTTHGNHEAQLIDKGDRKKRNLTIEFADGPQRSVEHVLRDDSGDPLRVAVELSSFDPSGLFWTPLWKHVSCVFVARVTSEDETLSGEVRGTVERRVLGTHSARALREDLRKEVQGYVLQALRN